MGADILAVTALPRKKDIFAVTLSCDADVWLTASDLVSKIDGRKLEQEPWFIYVFLGGVNLHMWKLFLLRPPTELWSWGVLPIPSLC